MRLLALALLITALVGCNTQTTPPSVWPQYGWAPAYQAVIDSGYFIMPNFGGMSGLCPKWDSLPQSEKLAVWGKLWSAIVKGESAFNRAALYRETQMSTDKITGAQVASQGLLSLSYQDTQWYKTPGCQKISWAHDRALPSQDLSATINDPIINLSCGMEIAAKLFKEYPNGHPAYKTGLGMYWSTARPGSGSISQFKAAATQCF